MNVVNNLNIEILIKIYEWIFSNVCNIFIGDILILLYNDYSKYIKVVCYLGFLEK